MKNIFLKIVLILATTLNSSCENYNTNESTGNDTFSCYINGKKYIPSAGTGIGGGDIRPFNTGPLTIGIRGKNVCGCSSWSYKNFTVITQSGGGGTGKVIPIQL